MVATQIPDLRSPDIAGLFGHTGPHASHAEWRRNQVIVRQDETPPGVFMVRSGVVRISTVTEDGRELILQFLGPGEIFGEAVLFDRAPSATSVVAHENASLSSIEADKLDSLMDSDPQLWARLSETIGRRSRTLERRIGDLVFLPVRRRLEIALCQLARKFGVVEGESILIPTRFSHAELARFIAASRVSVTLALGELERDDLAAQVGRRIRVQRALLDRTTQ